MKSRPCSARATKIDAVPPWFAACAASLARLRAHPEMPTYRHFSSQAIFCHRLPTPFQLPGLSEGFCAAYSPVHSFFHIIEALYPEGRRFVNDNFLRTYTPPIDGCRGRRPRRPAIFCAYGDGQPRAAAPTPIIDYAFFFVSSKATATALMPPASFPTITAGSISGANPAVKPR